MVDSIIDNIVDKDDFSNKKIIKLENYDKLRSEYKTVIENFNGICEVFDNKNPKSLPKDIELNSTIDKRYRNKKYISYGSESQINEEFTTPGKINPSTDGFDITKGFYKIQVIGAGSGGISYKYNNIYGTSSGNAGACCELYVYFNSNGHISGIIGKGSKGIKLKNVNNDDVLTVKGGDTEIYFNNNLIVKCCGGEGANIKQKEYIQTYGGEFIEGSYTERKNFGFNGGESNGGKEENKLYSCKIVKNESPFKDYGLGGNAITSNNDVDCNAEDGGNGYFYITSIKPSELGYLNENIGVESTKIHTLGNENEIRRNLKKALDTIYNKLIPITPLSRDICVEIGKTTELTPDETSAVKYKDITDDMYYKLSEVKRINDNNLPGFFNDDAYILTYDYNIDDDIYKIKQLSLKDWSLFNNNSMSQDFYTGFEKGNETSLDNKIIYVKNIPDINNASNIQIDDFGRKYIKVDVYEYKLNDMNVYDYVYLGIGDYYFSYTFNWNSAKYTDEDYNKEIIDDGFMIFRIVGAGGGGSGGSRSSSRHKGWELVGGGGGSGAYVCAMTNIKTGNQVKIKVGKGGYGGMNSKTHSSDAGGTGGDSYIKINNTTIATTHGGEGGQPTHRYKHGEHGRGGEFSINEPSLIVNLYESKNGDGQPQTASKRQYINQKAGGESVYDDTNYGAGGDGGDNGDGWHRQGYPGEDGYGEIYLTFEDKLIYNNEKYTLYAGENTFSSVIYNSDYQYDLQKLNRLKEYVASKDNWFDNDGYCQRKCQVVVQKS